MGSDDFTAIVLAEAPVLGKRRKDAVTSWPGPAGWDVKPSAQGSTGAGKPQPVEAKASFHGAWRSLKASRLSCKFPFAAPTIPGPRWCSSRVTRDAWLGGRDVEDDRKSRVEKKVVPKDHMPEGQPPRPSSQASALSTCPSSRPPPGARPCSSLALAHKAAEPPAPQRPTVAGEPRPHPASAVEMKAPDNRRLSIVSTVAVRQPSPNKSCRWSTGLQAQEDLLGMRKIVAPEIAPAASPERAIPRYRRPQVRLQGISSAKLTNLSHTELLEPSAYTLTTQGFRQWGPQWALRPP